MCLEPDSAVSLRVLRGASPSLQPLHQDRAGLVEMQHRAGLLCLGVSGTMETTQLALGIYLLGTDTLYRLIRVLEVRSAVHFRYPRYPCVSPEATSETSRRSCVIQGSSMWMPWGVCNVVLHKCLDFCLNRRLSGSTVLF